MNSYFISYRLGAAEPNQKRSIRATSAASVIAQIGCPISLIFALSRDVTRDKLAEMRKANPSGGCLSASDWEEAYGPITSKKHLWVRLTSHEINRPQLLMGRYTPRLCELTGHLRFPNVGEYYDNWVGPKA